VHVAEIVVGISGGDVDVDVADGMRAVNDGDDVVGAEEASEGGDGQRPWMRIISAASRGVQQRRVIYFTASFVFQTDCDALCLAQ
jgi:hypothetical protein